MSCNRTIFALLCILAYSLCNAQRFELFSEEVKTQYPSVVYDFLERYLYEIDSLESKGEIISRRLSDDKVFFGVGSAQTARTITKDTPFSISSNDTRYFEVAWSDTLPGKTILSVSFPMQYELLLGKPKVEIEKEFKNELSKHENFQAVSDQGMEMAVQDDSCLMTSPLFNYYVESLNTATYYQVADNGDTIPTFNDNDKWHSAANLFQGRISGIGDYRLVIEQSLYGYNKTQYSVALSQWLAYCQAMKLKVYFAIEEERQDGLKALLIAHSEELGFNHMLSMIIPDDFVKNNKAVLKCKLNAYIPTQNVKNLYQQYVKKPKKKI